MIPVNLCCFFYVQDFLDGNQQLNLRRYIVNDSLTSRVIWARCVEWLVHQKVYWYGGLDIERLIPPKVVHCTVKYCKCDGDKLELSDDEAFGSSCNALCDEPAGLNDNESLGESIPFATVLNNLLFNQRYCDFSFGKEIFKLAWTEYTYSFISVV